MELGFYWDEFYSSKFVAVMSIMLTFIATILQISLFIRAVYDFVFREKISKQSINRIGSKIDQISNIRNMSKLLLLSSLIWGIFYGIMAVSFVFMHLFLNFTPMNCANRSIVTIFQAFQRISLMLFFISRLHYTFVDTIFEIHSLYIKLFVIITVIFYNGASVWYVVTAYQTQNGIDCDIPPLLAPSVSIVLIDVAWNLFLGIYFQQKLREVLQYIHVLDYVQLQHIYTYKVHVA